MPYLVGLIIIGVLINEYWDNIVKVGLVIGASIVLAVIFGGIGFLRKQAKFSKLKNNVSKSTDYFGFLESLSKLSVFSEEKELEEKFSQYLEEELVRNDAIKGLVAQELSKNIDEPKIREASDDAEIRNLFQRWLLESPAIFDNTPYMKKYGLVSDTFLSTAAWNSIQSDISLHHERFDIPDCHITLENFHQMQTNINMIVQIASYGSEAIQAYLQHAPRNNELIALALLKALHQEGMEHEELTPIIDDYVHKNWNNHDAFIVIESILPLNKILPRDDYRDIVKQKSNLEVLHHQQMQHQEQMAKLDQVVDSQEQAIREVVTLTSEVAEGNRAQQEAIAHSQQALEEAKKTNKKLNEAFNLKDD